MIFAQGIFTGILTGTGMIDAMAKGVVESTPDALTSVLPPSWRSRACRSASCSRQTRTTSACSRCWRPPPRRQAQDPLAIGRAALLGQMTTGFPLSPLTASTFVLIGLAGVTLAEHQRFLFGWAFGSTVVMTVVARLIGAI